MFLIGINMFVLVFGVLNLFTSVFDTHHIKNKFLTVKNPTLLWDTQFMSVSQLANIYIAVLFNSVDNYLLIVCTVDMCRRQVLSREDL